MTTNLKAGQTGESHVDGHPFKVADHDAWTRSSNKRFLRTTARRYLAKMGGHPTLDRKALLALATREPKIAR